MPGVKYLHWRDAGPSGKESRGWHLYIPDTGKYVHAEHIVRAMIEMAALAWVSQRPGISDGELAHVAAGASMGILLHRAVDATATPVQPPPNPHADTCTEFGAKLKAALRPS